MKHLKTLVAGIALIAGMSTAAHAASTLESVKAAGKLKCGVTTGLAGFGQQGPLVRAQGRRAGGGHRLPGPRDVGGDARPLCRPGLDEKLHHAAADAARVVADAGFPDYRFTHGIYYLLAYCLGEMGQGQEAQVAYQTLIERFPDSVFVPEAWVRLGDWHFDEIQADSLRLSAQAFSRMYAFPEHQLFARAIYKLGWTYYRMDDYQNAVESFTRLLDHYVALARKTGEAPSGDV